MSKTEALITSSVIKWARERSGFSIEQAAKKIGRSREDIIDWESGFSYPSIAQARTASKVYKRPLAVFYLSKPPEDFETLRDFRSLPPEYSAEYSFELSLLIRTAQSRQDWMREYLIGDVFPELSFVGCASLNDSPIDIGKHILKTLNLLPKEQIECPTRRDALRLWIDKAESVGIYIFRKAKIDPKEARGFILCDKYAPFIYINSDDAVVAQIFTLAHELAHLWLNQSGISNLELIDKTLHDDETSIEVFCNMVASEAILDRTIFDQTLQELDESLSIREKLIYLSKIFKVSEEAIARRLKNDGIIKLSEYLDLRKEYQERWLEFKESEKERRKRQKSGPSYYVTKVFNNGYAFTETVIEAFGSGIISARDTSDLLDIKVNNIKKLADAAGMPFFK